MAEKTIALLESQNLYFSVAELKHMATLQKELWGTMNQRILLVDDSLDDLLFFEMALAQCSTEIEVIHAYDGEQALEILEHRFGFAPDLIVTDLNMPGMNGFDLLETLKAHPELSKLPAIVFTSSNEEQDRQRVMAIGVKGYHIKPVGYHEIAEEVRRIFYTYLTQHAPFAQASSSMRRNA